MRWVRSFARFVWDFVVGDDWRVAAALAGSLGLTWLLVRLGENVWWLLPLAVAAALAGSVLREANRRV
jgi:hypothetical protein